MGGLYSYGRVSRAVEVIVSLKETKLLEIVLIKWWGWWWWWWWWWLWWSWWLHSTAQFLFAILYIKLILGSQDIDDWDDVGVNTARPPDLLHLFRDYSKHVMEPLQKEKDEIKRLKDQIWQLVTGFINITYSVFDDNSIFECLEFLEFLLWFSRAMNIVIW